MKLTNYLLDLGRAVAYYPGLNKLTESVTASILLCQFLYWSDKSKDDGWIYKDNMEIEEETGLTYNQQKSAKRILEELGLVEYEFKRLDHKTRYKINQDELNRQWEELIGKKSKSRQKATEELTEEEKQILEKIRAEAKPSEKVEGVGSARADGRRTDAPVKGDILQGVIDTMASQGMKKMHHMNAIREKIEKKLRINTDNKKWEEFIEFVYGREARHNEKVEAFIDWAIENGWNPVYWTPEKMRTLWPQAYVKPDVAKPKEDFVQKLPPKKEESYAPMPKEAKIKKD